MISMIVDSIRVNLINPSRVMLLREQDGPRYLALVIGNGEADAIAVRLQNQEVPRPLPHDLLNKMVEDLGGSVVRVAITELVDTTYFATIFLDINGVPYELDARPSDAVALAIRADVPILVHPEVLDQAGFEPDQDGEAGNPDEDEVVPEEKLGVFREFINELDLDDLGKT